MRARLFAAAITAACLCLSACSERGIVNSGDTDAKSSSVSSSQAADPSGTSREENDFSSSHSGLEEEVKARLMTSAELLTEVLTYSTAGFSIDSDPASNHLQVPSEDDPNSINQFIYLMAAYQGRGYENSLYADWFRQDAEGIFHLSAQGIGMVLRDVLGVENWDPSTSNLDYDAAAQEYTSGLEFGVGRGGWKCGEIFDTQLDADRREVLVDYRADYLFPGAAGDREETTSWACRNTFSIGVKEDGQPYLAFVKSEIQ